MTTGTGIGTGGIATITEGGIGSWIVDGGETVGEIAAGVG